MSRTLLVCLALLFGCGGKKDDPKPDPKVEAEPAAPTKEDVARKQAEMVAAEAVKEAKAAYEQVEKLQADAEALSQRVDAAVDAIASAQSQADRDSATAALKALQLEKAELEARLAEAKAKSARAERMKGVQISKECLDNPLAKGCN